MGVHVIGRLEIVVLGGSFTLTHSTHPPAPFTHHGVLNHHTSVRGQPEPFPGHVVDERVRLLARDVVSGKDDIKSEGDYYQWDSSQGVGQREAIASVGRALYACRESEALA